MEDFSLKVQNIIEVIDAAIVKNDFEILKNINFSVTSSEFVYIIGNTGTGKSSFLKALFGINKFEGNKANVLGTNLLSINYVQLPKFRKNLGMIFQEYRLFDDKTIYQNLEFVLDATQWSKHSIRDTRIKEVLTQVGMIKCINQKVSDLSSGGKQKIAIGRALLNNPQIIIADEPTLGIDPQAAVEIMGLFHNLARKNQTTTIIATHDYSLIKKFPARVFECNGGTFNEL